MHALDLLKEPGKLPDVPVFALFGDDGFLRREVLKEIRRAVLGPEGDPDLAVAIVQGESAALADVLDELRTLPFFSKRRLVIVEGADPFVSAHRKELESYVERPAERGVLVLLAKVWTSTTKLAKLVEKHGLAVECKGPSERQLAPWLVHLARSRDKAELDPSAASLLIELVGPDVGLLANEVEKLSVYVGPSGKIHRDDVARMVGAGRIETIWKVLESATTGEAELAFEHLDGLLAAGEHPVGLLAAMSVSLLKVYHAGSLRRRRLEHKEACQSAGISPYGVEMTRRQHAHLGPARVDRLPAVLLRADLDLKGGSILPARTILERLLVELAGPRLD